MEKYIFKIRTGTQIRLRSADSKEGLLEHFTNSLRDCIARGQNVSFSKDGECNPANKYEASCAIYKECDGRDVIMLPPSQGGTFTELDEVLQKERAHLDSRSPKGKYE